MDVVASRSRSRSRAVAAIAALATIALVAVGASPAEAVPISRGQTTLIFNQNTSSGLDAQGIGILPIAPAEAALGGESFPITGGSASRAGNSARIHHQGGLAFVADNGTVRVRRLEVHICCRNNPDSHLVASVDGRRMRFLVLAGGRGTLTRRGVSYRGIHGFLTGRAANALNRGLGTGFFQSGTRLGKLRMRMTLVR
jgi:hypothetical protein